MAAAIARAAGTLPASRFSTAGIETPLQNGGDCQIASVQCKLSYPARLCAGLRRTRSHARRNLKQVSQNEQGLEGLHCEFQRTKQKFAQQKVRAISINDASAAPILDDGGGDDGIGGDGGKGNGRSGGNGGEGASNESSGDGIRPKSINPITLLAEGWRERVEADSSFPFKVLTEQIIGVGASVIGDMAGRPNFGLSELDFVFSTMIVGSILNFSLMYLLAPTMATAGAASLPGIFKSCPPGHMFEPGNFGLLARSGTFLYKGVQFAAIGFAAGLIGTGMTNLLLKLRKKMDPDYNGNESPPLVLNAATWALHMGLSSNLRYQALNGLEFLLAPKIPPSIFKAGIFLLRTANNVGGGASFSILAKATGSQKAGGS